MNHVHAVKNQKQISEIKTLLKHNHGELYSDIWGTGLNVSLRISDLLAIRYDQLDLVNRVMELVEAKTGKSKVVRLNQKAIDIVQKRRKDHPDDKFLFQVHSNRSKNKPVSRETVARAFKDVGDILKIKLGTHSMRKTRGYIMHSNGVSIEMICKVLNHSSPAVTMRYIGIEREQVLQTYDDYEI